MQHGLMPFLAYPDTPVFKERLQAGILHCALSGRCCGAAGGVLAQQEERPPFKCGFFLVAKKAEMQSNFKCTGFY